MKKVIFSTLFIGSLFFSFDASAQYDPTRNDIGKDCTTEDGKLGKWRDVTVTRQVGSTNSKSSSSSISGNGSIGSKRYGASAGGSISGSSSSSNGNSSSVTKTHNQIECVEDPNANLPQMTPYRW